MKQFFGIGLLALAAAVAGYFIARWLAPGPIAMSTSATKESLVGEIRPDFTLPDVSGQMHSIAEWDGEVILLNFWATWCRPCVEEMPMLDAMQEQYGEDGLQVIGIALDSPGKVRTFVTNYAIDYPILIAGMDGYALAERFGGGVGLPYSVLIARDSEVVKTMLGILDKQSLQALLSEYL